MFLLSPPFFVSTCVFAVLALRAKGSSVPLTQVASPSSRLPLTLEGKLFVGFASEELPLVRPCDFGPFGFRRKCSVLSPLSFVPSSLLPGGAPGGSDVGCARGLKGEGQGKRRRMAGDMVKEGQRKKRERKAWFVLV